MLFYHPIGSLVPRPSTCGRFERGFDWAWSNKTDKWHKRPHIHSLVLKPSTCGRMRGDLIEPQATPSHIHGFPKKIKPCWTDPTPLPRVMEQHPGSLLPSTSSDPNKVPVSNWTVSGNLGVAWWCHIRQTPTLVSRVLPNLTEGANIFPSWSFRLASLVP